MSYNATDFSYFEALLSKVPLLNEGCVYLIDWENLEKMPYYRVNEETKIVNLVDIETDGFGRSLPVDVEYTFLQLADQNLQYRAHLEIERIISTADLFNLKDVEVYIRKQFKKLEGLSRVLKTKITNKEVASLILKNLSIIKDEVSLRFNVEDVDTPNQDLEQKRFSIKWAGGVANLGTLFYELKYVHSSKDGKPIISSSAQELLKAIIETFVDENGLPFSESSLKTYLDPNRQDKKAKRSKIPINILPES